MAEIDGRERYAGEAVFRSVVVDPGGASAELARAHPMPGGDFGARHRERLQPADREAYASQDAARIGRQQPVGRPRPDFAQQHVAFAAEEPRLPVAFGFGGGHHRAPAGVVERFEQRRLVAARLRAFARRRLGARGGERAGAGLAELHVVGDRLGVFARDLFDHLGVHAARERPLQIQFVEGPFVDLDQHDVRRRPLVAADREAGVDGAQFQRAQQVGLVGDDREARGAQRHDRQQHTPQLARTCRPGAPALAFHRFTQRQNAIRVPGRRPRHCVYITRRRRRARTGGCVTLALKMEDQSRFVLPRGLLLADRYAVGEPISSGAMGAVYRAHDTGQRRGRRDQARQQHPPRRALRGRGAAAVAAAPPARGRGHRPLRRRARAVPGDGTRRGHRSAQPAGAEGQSRGCRWSRRWTTPARAARRLSTCTTSRSCTATSSPTT